MLAAPLRNFAAIAAAVTVAAILVSATTLVASGNGSTPPQTKAGTSTVTTMTTIRQTALSSSEQSSFTTDFTTDSGGATTMTTFADLTTSSQTSSNQTTQPGQQRCPVMAAQSPDDVPNAPAGPVEPLFGARPGVPANRTTIPPGVLLWESWTVSGPVVVCGAQTQFLPGNLTSSPVFAFYVDGKLATQASTAVPAGQPVTHNGTDWNVYMSTPLYINQTVAANSTVTLALFSSTPVTVFIIAGGGQTYESACASLPTDLPPSGNSTDYAIGMFGFG